jgi:glycosyltransferase involved in cell wall biosynthesis
MELHPTLALVRMEACVSSVDVVVPCFNYARYLDFCVQSVLTQRDVRLRMLIVDDASPDNTPQVASRIAELDERVTYVRNEKNLGLIATANRGVMDWATADYVVLLSADDALTPGSLARAAKLMDSRPEVALTFGMALMLHDDGPELKVEDVQNPPSLVIPGKEFLRLTCAHGNGVPTPTAVMRTAVHHRIGGYDPRFKHTSDANMWMRAAAVGSVAVINAVQAFYRWHHSNMSAAYHRRPVGDRPEMLETCADFLEKHEKEFPEFRRWFDQMRSRFCDEALIIASKAFEAEGDDTWRDSLEFAKSCWPDYRQSAVWRKFVVKRMLGRRLTKLVQKIEDRFGLRARPKAYAEWWEHGMLNGRWPGNAPDQEG